MATSMKVSNPKITRYDGSHNLRTELQAPLDAAEKDCRELVKIAKEVKLGFLYKKLGISWPEFCRKWTGHPQEFVEAMIRGVEAIGEKFPVPIMHAVQVGLMTHGGDRKSDEVKNQDCNTRLKYGSREHWIARLERDGKNELLQRIDNGELSAHAAAIEAGFRKKHISIEPTPAAFARYVVKHFTEYQQGELLVLISRLAIEQNP